MSEKRISTSPSAIHVKNRRETISTEEKSDVISSLEEGERIVDILSNVRFFIEKYVQFVIMLI